MPKNSTRNITHLDTLTKPAGFRKLVFRVPTELYEAIQTSAAKWSEVKGEPVTMSRVIKHYLVIGAQRDTFQSEHLTIKSKRKKSA